jgi:F-type H+-transporting ATPase subunit alpha
MANFRELAAFAQFGSDLDKATQDQLNRGRHLQEILKQPQYEPIPLENQVMLIFAGTNGYADKVPLDRMRAWELALLRFLETSYPEVGKDIVENKRITDENTLRLRAALDAFTHTWS